MQSSTMPTRSSSRRRGRAPPRPPLPIVAVDRPAGRRRRAVARDRVDVRAAVRGARSADRRAPRCSTALAAPGATDAERAADAAARARAGRRPTIAQRHDAERRRRWARHPDVAAFVARDDEIWRSVPGRARGARDRRRARWRARCGSPAARAIRMPRPCAAAPPGSRARPSWCRRPTGVAIVGRTGRRRRPCSARSRCSCASLCRPGELRIVGPLRGETRVGGAPAASPRRVGTAARARRTRTRRSRRTPTCVIVAPGARRAASARAARCRSPSGRSRGARVDYAGEVSARRPSKAVGRRAGAAARGRARRARRAQPRALRRGPSCRSRSPTCSARRPPRAAAACRR